MKIKPLNLVLGFVAVILLAVAGYMAVRGNPQAEVFSQQKTGPNSNLADNDFNAAQPMNPASTQTQQPANAASTTPPTDKMANWKSYTNSALGFSLKYPDGFEPSTELNDEYNKLTVFGNSKTKFFEVRLREDIDPDLGVKYGFLESEIVSRDINLDGVSGFKAVSATGYGDAGYQGFPFVEFAARRNGNVYHLIFYGDAAVSGEEEQILSTFKFMK